MIRSTLLLCMICLAACTAAPQKPVAAVEQPQPPQRPLSEEELKRLVESMKRYRREIVKVRWPMEHVDAAEAAKMLNARRFPLMDVTSSRGPRLDEWEGDVEIDLPANTVILHGMRGELNKAIEHLKKMDTDAFGGGG